MKPIQWVWVLHVQTDASKKRDIILSYRKKDDDSSVNFKDPEIFYLKKHGFNLQSKRFASVINDDGSIVLVLELFCK